MDMKVVTLNREQFAEACRGLEAMAASFRPDLILGIANGGVRVAEQMFAAVPHASVSCRRAGTQSKDRHAWAFGLIRRMPMFMRDWLRIAEARMLRGRAKSTEPRLDADISAAQRILVVDDAVDSGTTLAAVCELLRGKTFATAVITVTTPKPKASPTFALYRNTLIRFPWSKDA